MTFSSKYDNIFKLKDKTVILMEMYLMIEFICLFLPALVCVSIFEKLKKNRLSVRDFIFLYAFDNIIINGIIFAAKKFVFRTGDMVFGSFQSDTTPTAGFSFLLLGMFFSIILAFVEVIISQNFEVKVKELKDDEDDEEKE